nr:hypothetical protein [Tanacetum cinerariifolium]
MMIDESGAFIIQNHGLRDFCKITLRIQGDEFVIRNETVDEFTKQTTILCWMDGYMLVKEEDGSNLCVIDERTKAKTYLPSPPSKSTNETFTMLYDGREGKEKYKIIHVWPMSHNECVIGSLTRRVGCEILRIENDGVDSKWARNRAQDGLWDWEKYPKAFTKVKLPSGNVLQRPSEETERTRFLFESMQNLVVLYDIDIPKTTNETT